MKEDLYTYFEIELIDSSEEWNTTIVENIEEVGRIMQLLEGDFDDPSRKTTATVKGIAMSREAYKQWCKEYLPD